MSEPSRQYVLDTSALFAFTDNEDGADKDPEFKPLGKDIQLQALPYK